MKSMPHETAAGVHQAQEKCPEQLDDDFKLMFLRAEVFHVNLAAKRYCKYWDKRIELFGPEKAFLPLTLDGAFKDDHVALGMGQLRPLLTRDPKSGRPLVLMDPSRQDRTKYTRESKCRSLWYTFHSILKDDKIAQRKGIIMLAYGKNVQLSQMDQAQGRLNMESLRGCLPVRVAAFHLCHPPTFFALIFPFMKMMLGEVLRKRIRLHTGSDKKVAKTLEKKFGLAKDVLPTELAGNVRIDHQGWLKKQAEAGR